MSTADRRTFAMPEGSSVFFRCCRGVVSSLFIFQAILSCTDWPAMSGSFRYVLVETASVSAADLSGKASPIAVNVDSDPEVIAGDEEVHYDDDETGDESEGHRQKPTVGGRLGYKGRHLISSEQFQNHREENASNRFPHPRFVQPRHWSRLGPSDLVMYVDGPESGDETGPNHVRFAGVRLPGRLQNAVEMTTPGSLTDEMWQNRIRRKYARLYGILKEVNDYIGPHGSHRASQQSTPAAADPDGEQLQTAVVHQAPQSSFEGRSVDAGEKPARTAAECAGKVDVKKTGRKGDRSSRSKSFPNGCRRSSGDDRKSNRKTPASLSESEVTSNVIVVTSSCRRVENVTGVDSTARSSADNEGRVNSGSGLWFEFDLPTGRCCSDLRHRFSSNNTVSVSTRLALYKQESKRRDGGGSSNQTNSSSHPRHNGRRQHEADDSTAGSLLITVYQKRQHRARRIGPWHKSDGSQTPSSQLQLVGKRRVDRMSSDGWTMIELSVDNVAARAFVARCHVTSGSRDDDGVDDGDSSPSSAVDATELLVNVAVDRNSGNRRRHRRKELDARNMLKVPPTCSRLRSNDDQRTIPTRSAERKSRRAKSGRATCGNGGNDVRAKQILKHPFIELTLSSADDTKPPFG